MGGRFEESNEIVRHLYVSLDGSGMALHDNGMDLLG